MAQKFKETAHLHTDMEKYGEGYDRIFGKKENIKPEETKQIKEEDLDIKALAREYWLDCSGEQGSEGFPDSPSFIYGFMKGFEAAKRFK